MNASITPTRIAGKSLGPRDAVAMFFRHKKKAMLFATLVITAATLVILYAPRTYRSEARLFLQVGRESVRLDPTATTGDTIALQQSGRASEIATAIEVLKSRSILEQTVDKLTPETVLGETELGGKASDRNELVDVALAPLHNAARAIKSVDPVSEREEAVIAIEENFEVYAEFDSALIVLTLDAQSPQLAQTILDTIVNVYRDEHMRLYRTSGSKPFFEQQRTELEKQLVDAENALREAKNRMGVGSIESRRETLETRLSSIELARNATVQQKAAAEARIAALKERVDALPERLHTETRVMPNTRADDLRSQLYALQVQLMNLEAKYSDDHPLVKSARAQVEEATQMAQGETPLREENVDRLNENHQALSLALAQAESELAGYAAQQKTLDQQRAAALADLKQLNDFEIELEELNRQATLARTNFYNYAAAFEKARMDEELHERRISNVAVAQSATLAEKPVSPSKVLVGALSLVVMLAGTIALVLAAEMLDDRVRGEGQIEQLLQLPVVAAVPNGRVYAAVPTAV